MESWKPGANRGPVCGPRYVATTRTSQKILLPRISLFLSDVLDCCLARYCWRGRVFWLPWKRVHLPLSSSGGIYLLNDFGFEPSCHNICTFWVTLDQVHSYPLSFISYGNVTFDLCFLLYAIVSRMFSTARVKKCLQDNLAKYEVKIIPLFSRCDQLCWKRFVSAIK
jgi:hypothetical protein